MNQQEVNAREAEREALQDELNRGVREIHKTEKSIEGWAERVMSALLAPLHENWDKYPLGHGRRVNAGKSEANLWGKL